MGSEKPNVTYSHSAAAPEVQTACCIVSGMLGPYYCQPSDAG